jgi:RNA polymerase sigma-B factor
MTGHTEGTDAVGGEGIGPEGPGQAPEEPLEQAAQRTPGAREAGPPADSGQAPGSEVLSAEEAAEVEARTSSRWSESDRARERELLATLAAAEPGSQQHAAARDALVTLHLPLVQFLARRFRDRGEPLEDLVQVGTIGLIKAVDRFDLERGVEFSTYATPTIVGEIKRHFRDKGWAIRVPRRLQELRISIGQATAALAQRTGRSPTVAELAAHLGLSEDEILEGLEGAQAYSTASLDAQVGGEDDAPNLADRLGEDDAELENIEYRESLKPLIAALPARERRILVLRFFHGMTQSQIAEEIGISQMHVSRLLAKSLAVLRRGLTEDE